MGSESVGKAAFDALAASELVTELRETFGSRKTWSLQWRESQLKSLLKMTEENEQAIADTLTADLAKPEVESFIYEVRMILIYSSLSLSCVVNKTQKKVYKCFFFSGKP